MAAAPKKTDDAKGNAPAAAETKAGGKKKILLFAGLGVLLVAISVGGTIAALKFLAPADKTAAAEEVAAPKALEPAVYMPLSPNFTISFHVNGRQRFLQAEITLMYRDSQLTSLLDQHMPAIRNNLVMLMSGKNFDELQTEAGKDVLRGEALAAVQAIITKEQQALKAQGEEVAESTIEQVLFTNFVMQ